MDRTASSVAGSRCGNPGGGAHVRHGTREFVALLGGAAAAWPVAARAQQPERLPRIGVLMGFAADDLEGRTRLRAFLQALQQFGWTDSSRRCSLAPTR